MRRRKYRVTGARPVLDHAPGDEFEADIPEPMLRRLLRRGSLTEVGRGLAEPPAKSASREEWDTFAGAAGIDPTDYPTKDDLIAAVAAATRPTEEAS